jgi:hypothetical protein
LIPNNDFSHILRLTSIFSPKIMYNAMLANHRRTIGIFGGTAGKTASERKKGKKKDRRERVLCSYLQHTHLKHTRADI